MQTQSCTYTNDGGVPPTIVSSYCTTSGTSTVALAGTSTVGISGSVVAYDPFIEASIAVALWILVAIVTARLISSFR